MIACAQKVDQFQEQEPQQSSNPRTSPRLSRVSSFRLHTASKGDAKHLQGNPGTVCSCPVFNSCCSIPGHWGEHTSQQHYTMTRAQSPISHMSALLLATAAITAIATAAALPINGGLTREGINNKLRSGSIAIANNRHPSDVRWERVVQHNGGEVQRENLLPPTACAHSGGTVPGEEYEKAPSSTRFRIPAKIWSRPPQTPQGQARKTTHRVEVSDVEAEKA